MNIFKAMKPEKVYEQIRECTNHGATLFKGLGFYQKKERSMVYSVVSSDEVHMIIRKIRDVDNAAFISGEAYGPLTYESGSRNEYDRFRRLSIQSNGHDMTITDETGKISKVITSSGCYNFMARDIIGNAEDPQKATQIFASSRAVIHLIDRALTPKK